jgi:hypothetical protein
MEGAPSAPPLLFSGRELVGSGLRGPVDALFETGATDDLVAVAEPKAYAGLAVLVPEPGDALVQLLELRGEDDVPSGGQALKENGAVLAGALDLATDFLNRLHAHENEAPSLAIPSTC